MSDFEAQMRKALARKEPSPQFTAKVMAELSRREGQSKSGIRKWRWNWMAPVFAALMCVVVGLGYQHQRRVEEQQGLRARQQVMVALKLTGSKLRQTQMKLERFSKQEGIEQ